MMKNTPMYAPIVLRLALTAVVVWFGVSQLSNPGMWTGIVPEWIMNLTGFSADMIVRLNGWFEVIAGFLLGVGIWTRWVALLLALHLYLIAAGFGTSAIAIRDYGLATCLLALAMFGNDTLCYHYTKDEPVA